jgi:hypothetical protein
MADTKTFDTTPAAADGRALASDSTIKSSRRAAAIEAAYILEAVRK